MERIGKLKTGEPVFASSSTMIDKQLPVTKVGFFLGSVESKMRSFICYTGWWVSGYYWKKVIRTTSDNDSFYAFRPKKEWPSRFVRGASPKQTNWVSILLNRNRNGSYFLLAAYPGKPVPPEIWDERAHSRNENFERSFKHSVDFWSSHAFVGEHIEHHGAEKKDEINGKLLELEIMQLDLQLISALADELSMEKVELADPEHFRFLVKVHVWAAHVAHGLNLSLDPQSEGYRQTKNAISTFAREIAIYYCQATREDESVMVEETFIDHVLEEFN